MRLINKIQICLVTHNRPEYATIALTSILNQSFKNFDILVSDNSSNNDFKKIINKNFTSHYNLKYVFREPSLSAIEHLNTLINESTEYDFVVFFHDDDILEPFYLDEIIKNVNLNKNNFVAIGTNAKIIKNNKITSKVIWDSKKKLIINSKFQLVNQYFNLEYNGTVPFPSYFYRVSSLLGNKFDKSQGGKYCDLIFLINLLNKGNLLWLSEPLMQYRIHSDNDSNFLNISDRKLLMTVLKNQDLVSKSLQIDYYFIIIKELYSKKKISSTNYLLFILKYVLLNIKNKRFFKILYTQLEKKLNSKINFKL